MHAYTRAPMFIQQKQCNNFISYTVTLYRCFATILRTYGAFFECRVSCFSRLVPHSQLVFAFSRAHASCEHTYLHKNMNAYFYHLHAYFSVTLYIFVHLRCTLFIKKYVYACLHISRYFATCCSFRFIFFRSISHRYSLILRFVNSI